MKAPKANKLIEKAINYYQLDDDKKAIEILTKKELVNNSEALFLLGEIYYSPEKGCSNIKKDIKKAIEYWEKAIKLKHSESAYQLGYKYLIGTGVKTNLNRAEHYFKLGFKFKTWFYEFCGLELIEIYIDNKEYEKGIDICNLLINDNLLNGSCNHKLYRIYSIKDSTIYNLHLSMCFLRKGVSTGYPPSCIKLANLLIKEGCSKKDIKEAIDALNNILLHEKNDLYFTETKEKIISLQKKLQSK